MSTRDFVDNSENDVNEVTPVTVTVAPLTAAYGKQRLRFTTVVTLTIADVEVVLQGVAIVTDKRGNLSVEMPQTRHPSTGVSYPAIALPTDLHRAIEVEVLSLIPGARAIVTQPEAAP